MADPRNRLQDAVGTGFGGRWAGAADSNPGQHHHLVCVRCGRVMDFEDARLDDLPLPDPSRTGFHTTDYSIQFTGVCAECQQNTRTSN